MNNDTIFLIMLTAVILWTVMTTRLLRSVIGLALTSVMLSIMMFRLDSPIAAVFELSVCAGLITVIFFTAISFTERLSPEKLKVRKRERLVKFWFLPFVAAILWTLLSQYNVKPDFKVVQAAHEGDVRNVMWNLRHMDILGQIVVLLAGAFGTAVLFKDRKD